MPAHHTKSRKRKRIERETREAEYVETAKPSAVFEAPGKGRAYTLSLALPGSIIANAQSHDLKNALAGRVARAAAVFCVDEIVIFDDGQSHSKPVERPQHKYRSNGDSEHEDGDEYTGWSDPDHFLCHLLSYLECPPNLRKKLFPMHPNLRTAGALPSLDMPHHLKPDEWCEYREGVTLEQPSHYDPGRRASKKQKGSIDEHSEGITLVDTGLTNRIEVDGPIPPYTRLTVKMPKLQPLPGEPLKAEVVAPSEAREESGFYWGYSVRKCSSLSTVFTESPYDGGYDTSIGTSERGNRLEEILPKPLGTGHQHTNGSTHAEQPQRLPEQFSHLLMVFGGVAGLEAAAEADGTLKEQGINRGNVSQLFDAWINVCPGQGSRTIRTEEAIWLGLAAVKPYVDNCGCSGAETGKDLIVDSEDN